MRTFPRVVLVALAAVVPLALTSTALAAQQKTAACKATAMPMNVRPGAAASRVSISLSRPIGPVTGFHTAEANGPKLASPEAMPKMGMTNPGKKTPEKPIKMANTGNRLTLWLNTASAKPGTYIFTVVGSQGSCSGKMKVGSKG